MIIVWPLFLCKSTMNLLPPRDSYSFSYVFLCCDVKYKKSIMTAETCTTSQPKRDSTIAETNWMALCFWRNLGWCLDLVVQQPTRSGHSLDCWPLLFVSTRSRWHNEDEGNLSTWWAVWLCVLWKSCPTNRQLQTDKLDLLMSTTMWIGMVITHGRMHVLGIFYECLYRRCLLIALHVPC